MFRTIPIKAALLGALCFWTASALVADPIPAMYLQGSTHGFLLLRDEAGKIIAVGDQVNLVRGRMVRSRLIFRFRDGSIDDEVTTFRQGKTITLVTDHHVQKGPSFPKPVDMSVNVPAGTLTWTETRDGKAEVHTAKTAVPADLANGIIAALIQNFPRKQPEVQVPFFIGDGKPRLVKLRIRNAREDQFQVGGTPRRSRLYSIHVELGGVVGAVATVLGKDPPDTQVWALEDEVPTILRMAGPFYQDGPIWTVTLTGPTWSGEPTSH